jgi:acetoin utilization deacetylase AcuC-like enzyme
MVSVFYSPQYVWSDYSFDTTRKAKLIADSLTASSMARIALVEPVPLTRDQVALVHDPGYIRAVETGVSRELAESQGFTWDANLWPMVLASNGGAVAASLAALEQGVAGSLSSGLHHARRGRGAGFCTFNGLVSAARAALTAGARSVLILDFDAHCGGGTRSLIEDDPRIWQIDVSVSRFDGYPSSNRVWLEFAAGGGRLPAHHQPMSGTGAKPGTSIRPVPVQRRHGPIRGLLHRRQEGHHARGFGRPRRNGV